MIRCPVNSENTSDTLLRKTLRSSVFCVAMATLQHFCVVPATIAAATNTPTIEKTYNSLDDSTPQNTALSVCKEFSPQSHLCTRRLAVWSVRKRYKRTHISLCVVHNGEKNAALHADSSCRSSKMKVQILEVVPSHCKTCTHILYIHTLSFT